jgi:TetR/AcrR family transcriptional regulator, mexJK operon transcriptional repressor
VTDHLLQDPHPTMVGWGVLMNETMIRKGRKFDQVLDGARTVFMRDGFEGASVDEIARAAGVSKATLYSYFPDKRLMFTEILRTECRRQTEEAEAEIAVGGTIEQMLTMAGERIADFLMSDFGLSMVRLVMTEGQRFPEITREFYSNGPGLIHERLVFHFGHMVELGALKIDDLDLAADQFAQLCKAAIHEKLLFGMSDTIRKEDVTRSVTGAVEMFLARYGTGAVSKVSAC